MSAEPDERSTVRWRLDLSYDGTNFSGWANQVGRRTVQGELESWITRVLRLDEPAQLVCGLTLGCMLEAKLPTWIWIQWRSATAGTRSPVASTRCWAAIVWCVGFQRLRQDSTPGLRRFGGATSTD